MSFFKNLWARLHARLAQARRRTLIVAVVGMLVFLLPTALAIGWALGADTPTQKLTFSITLLDENRVQISQATASEDPTNGTNLADILYRAITEGQPIDRAPVLPEDGTPLYVITDQDGVKTEYICYFSLSDDDSYYITADSSMFLIPRASASEFLNLPEAECLYDDATPPSLFTNTADAVTPSTSTWFYKAHGGEFRQAGSCTTTGDLLPYEFAGALELYFEDDPDSCYIRAVEQETGEVVYEGTYRELSQITVHQDTVLQIHLRAEWKDSPKAKAHGTLTYDFMAVLRDRAAFSLNRTTFSHGEFLLLKCTNIRTSSKLSITCAPELPLALYIKEETAYCIIPYPDDTQADRLNLTASYGASIQKFTVTLRPPEDEQSFPFTNVDDAVRLAATPEAQQALTSLLASSHTALSDTVYFRGNILSLPDFGFTEGYQFGNTLTFPSSPTSIIAKGSEYLAPVGTSIPTLAAGEVVAMGSCEALGNYVVVNHGLGIETWYAHLSDFDVRVGDILAEGESLGKAGIGGLYSGSGVLVLCTVNGHLCNPASLKK